MNTTATPFFNRLYVRIWLAVVLSVAVLIFLVGWAWRESAERKLADYSSSPVVREVMVRNAAGEVVGTATAAPRVPGMGAGTEFSVTLNQPLAAGEVVGIQMPRARRLNPQTGELEQISPQELRERLGRAGRMNRDRDTERGRDRDRSERLGHPFGMDGSPGNPADKSWFKPPFGFVWMLMLVGLAVALGTYPLIRRLTKRLNVLQSGVEQWGQGDLSTRVKVSGNDEVAFLAKRFNTAASRIEALVGSHKSLLANASHELRSPLTRIKMGLELMTPTVGTDVSALPPEGANFPRGGSSGNSAASPIFDKHKAEISRNINELDQLIAEILLASRLDSAQADVGTFETVDLTGLAAEECAKSGAELQVLSESAIAVQGVPKLLRRLMRNLLENANRYAIKNPASAHPEAVVLTLAIEGIGDQKTVVLRVTDHGPGVPAELRERIFEPFYRASGASERDGGVGLGLALVKSIAQRHGGSVRCEAAASGQGACFVVTLPI
jgi:two-component system, OmpR family, sensor kinase